jgi:hypothetical protein
VIASITRAVSRGNYFAEGLIYLEIATATASDSVSSRNLLIRGSSVSSSSSSNSPARGTVFTRRSVALAVVAAGAFSRAGAGRGRTALCNGGGSSGAGVLSVTTVYGVVFMCLWSCWWRLRKKSLLNLFNYLNIIIWAPVGVDEI